MEGSSILEKEEEGQWLDFLPAKTSEESGRVGAHLIFVTDSRTVSVEKKSVMWRNVKFLYVTNVKKSEISPHVD